ncbi:hypothetical protein KC725_05530 [Candidatus Peregrinibacteria bacterium]|nr:hypothetical protein [Candidatus Peregrinibacteria bacterium]
MGRKDDNLARPLGQEEMDAIDEGWVTPESGIVVKKETSPEEAVQGQVDKIGGMIQETLEAQKIDIEDVFKPGKEALKKLLNPIPKGLTILSGDSEMEKRALDGFGDEKIFVASYPGRSAEHKPQVQSRDGVSIMVRENPLEGTKTASIVLVHSETEEDFNAAALVNAASIAAANHVARETNMPKATDVFVSMDNALDVVREELDAHTDLDMMHVLIQKDNDDKTYKLDVAKVGKMHCMTIDPYTGKYDYMNVPLKFEPYRTKHEEHGMTEEELQATYDEEAHEREWIVAPGEIVLLATDLVVQTLGGRNKIVEKITEMLSHDKDLQEIESAFIEAVRIRQDEDTKGKFKDLSASIVLFRAV